MLLVYIHYVLIVVILSPPLWRNVRDAYFSLHGRKLRDPLLRGKRLAFFLVFNISYLLIVFVWKNTVLGFWIGAITSALGIIAVLVFQGYICSFCWRERRGHVPHPATQYVTETFWTYDEQHQVVNIVTDRRIRED